MLKWAALLLIVSPLAARAEAPARSATRAPPPATKAAAAISLQDFAGHRVGFSTLQRDATLIALWSAACVPCIEEMPLLDACPTSKRGSAATHPLTTVGPGWGILETSRLRSRSYLP